MLESARAVPTIAVADLDRARKFYEETLGFKALDETPAGIRFEMAGGSWIFVYPTEFAGTNKATYMSFEVEDIEATVKEMKDAGITFEEYDFPGLKTVDSIAELEGEKGAWFKDLDGNILAIGEVRR